MTLSTLIQSLVERAQLIQQQPHSALSAVSSQARSLLYSANMYKESCLEVFVLLQAQSQAEWRFRGEHDLLDTIPQSPAPSLRLCLWGSFRFFQENKSPTRSDWVRRSSAHVLVGWRNLDFKIPTTKYKNWYYKWKPLCNLTWLDAQFVICASQSEQWKREKV